MTGKTSSLRTVDRARGGIPRDVAPGDTPLTELSIGDVGDFPLMLNRSCPGVQNCKERQTETALTSSSPISFDAIHFSISFPEVELFIVKVSHWRLFGRQLYVT